jgi:hypothetical protein
MNRLSHSLDRQTNNETRAQWFRRRIGIGRADVFGPDHTRMRGDNLLGNRKAKARVVAKLALGTLRIEALENLGQGIVGDTRTSVFDNDQNTVLAGTRPNPERVALFTL